jgi:beta-mannosidase
VWNRLDYRAYRQEVPLFCSEFGTRRRRHGGRWRNGCTQWTAARSPLPPQVDPVFFVHQNAQDGNGKLERGMAPHLGVPGVFDDWHWAAQLQQARAVRYGVEHCRSWWPRTAGSIVWQLNDCWPVISCAAVDFQERPKPVWCALRQARAPRMLMFVERVGRAHMCSVARRDEEREPCAVGAPRR